MTVRYGWVVHFWYGMCTCSKWFGVESIVFGDGMPAMMLSWTWPTSDVWVGSLPSSGRGMRMMTLESNDILFYGGRSSSSRTRLYTPTSVTGMGMSYMMYMRSLTTSSSLTGTALLTNETALGSTSSRSNTQMVPFTLYQCSNSASSLEDSAYGYSRSGSPLS